jgi:hypothetical protein
MRQGWQGRLRRRPGDGEEKTDDEVDRDQGDWKVNQARGERGETNNREVAGSIPAPATKAEDPVPEGIGSFLYAGT